MRIEHQCRDCGFAELRDERTRNGPGSNSYIQEGELAIANVACPECGGIMDPTAKGIASRAKFGPFAE